MLRLRLPKEIMSRAYRRSWVASAMMPTTRGPRKPPTHKRVNITETATVSSRGRMFGSS